MRIEQIIYKGGKFNVKPILSNIAEWVLVFGSRNLIEDNKIFDQIREMYPIAYIMGCSSSGEIQESYVSDGQLNITAIHLEKAKVVFKEAYIAEGENHFDVGVKIMSGISETDLKHVLVLSEGVNINGSKLVEGMRSCYKNAIPITGGLAGDEADFLKTAVIANGYARPNTIVLAALYGNIKIGYSSCGGWSTFGIERLVTKSKDNVLFEIDSKPALNLYKEYLGEYAKQLPASGLRFPMAVRLKNSENYYIRSVSAINSENNSLIFAGDIPQNAYCRLMKTNAYDLVDAARMAADLSLKMIDTKNVQLAIIISCYGRKFLLKQRVDEEIETIRECLGEKTIITGYYSYGEIAPHKKNSLCEMHNETMVVTLFSEEG